MAGGVGNLGFERSKGVLVQLAERQRDGLCCLFDEDAPTAVLECSGDKIGAVHRIADGRVVESMTNVEEALGNNEIRPMVMKINAIEQRLKDEDAVFRDREGRSPTADGGSQPTEKPS